MYSQLGQGYGPTQHGNHLKVRCAGRKYGLNTQTLTNIGLLGWGPPKARELTGLWLAVALLYGSGPCAHDYVQCLCMLRFVRLHCRIYTRDRVLAPKMI